MSVSEMCIAGSAHQIEFQRVGTIEANTAAAAVAERSAHACGLRVEANGRKASQAKRVSALASVDSLNSITRLQTAAVNVRQLENFLSITDRKVAKYAAAGLFNPLRLNGRGRR